MENEINKNDTIDENCLILRQADYVYKKVELGSLISKNSMKEEIDPDVELDRMDNNSRDENPYRELIVNNASKIECMLSQMEQWSILSNVINYVQYSKNPRNFHTMSIKPTNKNEINVGRKEGEKDRFTSQVGLMDTSDRLTLSAPSGNDCSFQPVPSMTILLFIVTILPHQMGLLQSSIVAWGQIRF